MSGYRCYSIVMGAAIIDMERFREFVGDDEGYGCEMANLFIQQATDYLRELEMADHYNSIEEWREVAHRFKGMAGFSGAVRLQASCLNAQNNFEASPEERGRMFCEIKSDVEDAVKYFDDHFNGG